jgi:alpha-beta hydrolase superfamily lysophospholipase
VLAHDDESNRSEMLPLVQPLHDAGFVVLVAGLRTSGATNVGGTFGLREGADIQAAVELLRRRPGVDPARIAVVGIGTGANAAILAAEADPTIAALVLDRPTRNAGRLMIERLVPPKPWLAWLTPLCRWGFELAYGVDAGDLGLDRHHALLTSRPVLVFDESTGASPTSQSSGIGRIVAFLRKHLDDNTQSGVDHK